MPITDININKYTGPKVDASVVTKADYAYMLTHLKQTTNATKIIKHWESRSTEFNTWIEDILYSSPDAQAELAAQSTNPDVKAAVDAYRAQFAKKPKAR